MESDQYNLIPFPEGRGGKDRSKKLHHVLLQEIELLRQKVGELEDEKEERNKIDSDNTVVRDRIRKHNEELAGMARREELRRGDLMAFIKHVTERCAETLSANRVSLWLFESDREHLNRVDLFERNHGHHSEKVRVERSMYSEYFLALQQGRASALDDVFTDPAMSEFIREYGDSYLKALGITAVLAAPIFRAGELEGAISVEHVGDKRKWLSEEQDFLGSVADFIALAIETHERFQAENRYRLLADNVKDMIWVMDLDLKYKYMSPSVEAFRGYTVEEALAQKVEDVLTPDSYERAIKALQEEIQLAQEHGYDMNRSITLELELRCKDGSTKWAEANISYVERGEGEAPELIGVSRDISDRVEARRALEESETRYRILTDNLRDIVWAADPDGRLTYVSPYVEVLSGFSPAELLGQSIVDVLAKSSHAVARKHLHAVAKGQDVSSMLEIKMPIKSGGTIWCEANIVALRDENGEVISILGITRDISERKRAEEALLESETKYRRIVETTQEGIWLLDTESNITFVNERMASMLGYTVAEMQNRSMYDFVDEDNRKVASESWVQRNAGDGERHSFPFKRRDGSTLWAIVSGSPTYDKHGGFQGTLAMITDITRQREAEEQSHKIEAQMQHAQKLESLGVLAGGIAHDFNNLLVGILGNASLASSEISSSSPVQDCLSEIEESSQRAADLVRQLLAYAGQGKFEIKQFDLSELVSDMAHLLESSISKKAVLNYSFADELPLMEGDITQIRQIVMNLITNASDALEDQNGLLTIKTGYMHVNHAYLSGLYLNDNLEEGQYIYIKVSDTGKGMSPETVSKIFDPFFSTKFEGRGLGLAAVLGIVQSHYGGIRVDSQPGNGTSFRVLFPPVKKAVPSNNDKTPALTVDPNTWSASGLVLIVDDEKAIRSTVSRALERVGFTVLVAEDGEEGVRLFEKRYDEISLVLLDLTMPRMNGEEALEEMLRIDESACIILSTGYSGDEVAERFTGCGLAGFIQKPYRAQDLYSKIREVLET